MRFRSTYVHASIDYAFVILCLLVPVLFYLGNSSVAVWSLWFMGSLLLAVDLLTDYDISFVRWLPIRLHLDLDLALGLGLMGAPWILGFASEAWIAHVVLGAALAGAALLCHVRPEPVDASQPQRAR